MRTIVFLLLTLMGCGFASTVSAEQGDPSIGKPYVYKVADGKSLYLWIIEPSDVGSTDASHLRAAVALFFGGGWIQGKPAQLESQAKVIAQHGGIGVLVRYRVMSDHTQEPRICVEDTKSAMRWLREHARKLRIDPNRLAIGGGSAGGYDAAYATMAPGWDAPGDDLSVSPGGDAMVLWNPVIDTSEHGYSHASFGDDATRRSPMTYLNAKTPPMLIQVGSNDALIHADVLRDFASKAKSLGVRCDLIVYDGQSHGFFNKEPFLEQTNDAMAKFLSSLGYIRP